MSFGSLTFIGKNIVAYNGKQARIRLGSTINSQALLKELAYRRDRVVESSSEQEATIVTGLDNGCVHHYKSGKSSGVKVKTVLKHLDATGTWPGDLAGLPHAMVEKLLATLVSLGWQPDPVKSRVYRRLVHRSNDYLAFRAMEFSHSIEIDSLLQYWTHIESSRRLDAVQAAKNNFEQMKKALRSKQFDIAHIYHVEGHKSFIDPKLHLLVGAALDISLLKYELHSAGLPLDAYISETSDSHLQLSNMYLTWDSPSKSDEAMYYLDVRYTKTIKLLRELSC